MASHLKELFKMFVKLFRSHSRKPFIRYGSECGSVDGSWCVKGKDYTSGETVVHGGGSSRPGYSTTKRETGMLPKFGGDEKYAFLNKHKLEQDHTKE